MSSNGLIDRVRKIMLGSDGNFTYADIYVPLVLGKYRIVSTYNDALAFIDPNDQTEYLYYLVQDTENGQFGIVRTKDETLRLWDYVASIPSTSVPIGIFGLPGTGTLFVTTAGVHSNIWIVNPIQSMITPLATPTVTPTSTPAPPQSPITCRQCDLNNNGTVELGAGGADQSLVVSCFGRPISPSVTPSPGEIQCIRADYMPPRFVVNSGDLAKFMSACGGYAGNTCTRAQCTITADVNRDSHIDESDVVLLEKSGCRGSTIWSPNWFECRVYDVFHDDQISDQDIVGIRECM